jgi:hypothetical protein
MFKGFEYNKECRKFMDRSVYAQEHKVLSDFWLTDNENVRLEYGNVREAINASQALKTWVRENRRSLKIAQRSNYVFAFKKIED